MESAMLALAPPAQSSSSSNGVASSDEAPSSTAAREPVMAERQPEAAELREPDLRWAGQAAGAPPDVLVRIDGSAPSMAMHMAKLFSKTDYFARIAEHDVTARKLVVNVVGLPGRKAAFELVANFCYGLKCDVNPGNVAQLYCAAMFLHMDDDTRPGLGHGGNLVSICERHIQDYVKEWETAAMILHTCASFQPLAMKLSLIPRCLEALTADLGRAHMQHQREVIKTEAFYFGYSSLCPVCLDFTTTGTKLEQDPER
eukprot:SM000022S07240  [mRNA]  locus=s22:715126:717113:+ [translate_table: standard]